MEYGFNLDEFTVVADTVRNGDSFGELMLQNKVDYPKIALVAERYKDTFDVRRIRVGKPYLILKSKDTTQAAQVFIYQEDPINYTVIDFRDSVVAYKEKRPVNFIMLESVFINTLSCSNSFGIIPSKNKSCDYHTCDDG